MNNTLEKSIQEPTGIVNRFLHRLVRFVPRHMKRAILWASVVCACRRSVMIDAQCVNSLNSILKLCEKQGAINISVTLSRAIWKDIDGAVQVLKTHPTTPDQLDLLSDKFVKAIPEWLRYSGEKRMGADFQMLLRNRSLVGI